MKKQITTISPVQSAKVMAALYFVISVPFALIMLFTVPGGFSKIFLLLAPVLYGVMGFVCTVIGAAIYNFVASKVGGIEFTTTAID